MTRIPLLGALLIVSLAAHAQTAPATPAVPSPLPPAAQSAGSNPFAPRVNAPAAAAGPSAPQAAPAPVAPPMTEESVKANVESSFRAQGDRVGRVNGQTFFKISADKKSSYLFIPTGLQDAQPVVPNARSAPEPSTSNAVPPHVPMPTSAPAAAPAAPATTPPQN